jgi:hypothetical protein
MHQVWSSFLFLSSNNSFSRPIKKEYRMSKQYRHDGADSGWNDAVGQHKGEHSNGHLTHHLLLTRFFTE